MKTSQFIAKRIYLSDKGLHLEFATEAEAKAFYEDGLSRGINSNKLDGLTVIKTFKKPARQIEQAV
jgi:hypothetical protein